MYDGKKTGFAENPKSKKLKLPLKLGHKEKVAYSIHPTHFKRQGLICTKL